MSTKINIVGSYNSVERSLSRQPSIAANNNMYKSEERIYIHIWIIYIRRKWVQLMFQKFHFIPWDGQDIFSKKIYIYKDFGDRKQKYIWIMSSAHKNACMCWRTRSSPPTNTKADRGDPSHLAGEPVPPHGRSGAAKQWCPHHHSAGWWSSTGSWSWWRQTCRVGQWTQRGWGSHPANPSPGPLTLMTRSMMTLRMTTNETTSWQ